ncbi:MAG: DUF1236 domain-containing protein [Sphingomonadaceae bacterium]
MRPQQEQAQRERPAQPAEPRAQEPQRSQAQQREQRQGDREQRQGDGRRDVEQAQPPGRAPGSRESAQPQRPESRQGPASTAQPGATPGQDEQREQRQGDRRDGRRDIEQAQPQGRTPGSLESAQPQRPETRPGPAGTAQPGATPGQDERQRAPNPSAQQQPAGAPAPDGRSPTERQSAEGQRPDADRQRIVDTVRERVERNEIRPVQSLGVAVTVGAALPSRVQLQPVPREVVSIRPQYRDYRYTVSEREIIIVDPRSRRVVEVIERGGRSGSASYYAVFEQRRDVRRWRRPDAVIFQQGVVLPASAPYYDVPVEIVERNPNWRGHQFVMTETDEIAIVEPRTHRIVEVIDRSGGAPAPAAATTTASTGSQPAANASSDRHEIARIILGNAKPGDMQGIDGLKGAVLPSQVVLRPLPPEAEERDQQLRGFQYTLIGDDVLIVDPQSRRIVDVIE